MMHLLKHLAFIGCIGIASSVCADTLSSDELQKRAILKLIEENKEMGKRIISLELKVSELESKNNRVLVGSESKKVDSKKETKAFFTPYILSTVREQPTSTSKYLLSIKNTKRHEIYEIKCKGKDIGYWGKIDEGWVFISNPDYGTLTDSIGSKLSQDYSKWCSK